MSKPSVSRVHVVRHLAALLLALPTAAYADLGSADMTDGGGNTSGTVYEAWCSRKRMDCKVSFHDGRLSVNEGAGIASDQVVSLYKDRVCRQYRFGIASCFQSQYDKDFYITYRSSSGAEKTALITFKHQPTSEQFQRDLEIWSGSVLRPIGPSLKIEE